MPRKRKELVDNPARWKQIKEKYGLSKEDYNKIVQEQRGVCFICQRSPYEIRRRRHLAVDHDHHSGQIRGLLCYSCNHKLLPSVKEDPAFVRRLLKYLTRKVSYGKVPNS